MPSSTVTQACISANQAITSGAEKILSGQADIVVAGTLKFIMSQCTKYHDDAKKKTFTGGVETFSDVPIRFSKPIRQRLLQAQKVMKKGTLATLGLLKGLKLKDLTPEAPAIANYTTGEVMVKRLFGLRITKKTNQAVFMQGHSSDRLAAKFGVSRRDQDEFTVSTPIETIPLFYWSCFVRARPSMRVLQVMSHVRAAKAHMDGLYVDEIVPVDGNIVENGIKGDSTLEKVSKLKPAFIKPHGTHTAANSSFLTDGASATLIMSEEKALQLGYKPKAYIRGWTYVGVDPFEGNCNIFPPALHLLVFIHLPLISKLNVFHLRALI